MKFSLPAVLAPLAVLALPTEDAPPDAGPSPTPYPVFSVDRLFKDEGKVYFGASSDDGILEKGDTAAIISQKFGQVTPEYSMKWGWIHPKRDYFEFQQADNLVRWAQENGDMVVRGHTLLWDNGLSTGLPTWVTDIKDPENLTEVIETHVKTVVEHFKGKVRSWDVVNEPFNDNGTLKNTHFMDVLGEEYIGIAFRAAKAADPDAKLYINDYNLEVVSYGKVGPVVDKVNQWISEGIPIDGIGSETHLAPGFADEVQGALERLADSNVSEVAITELDIDGAPPDQYATVAAACLNVSKCVGVTVWGISDKDSWKADKKPLLFDENYEPKPAYWAIVEMLWQRVKERGTK
ncbi:family 10 glycosyl hydrolase [Colletotrichum sublineola]|nr:family 10 glycosyl hydrolase [Colletotrichum sublineola]